MILIYSLLHQETIISSNIKVGTIDISNSNGNSGDGGNVNIVSPFIIALPNQDNNISANAF